MHNLTKTLAAMSLLAPLTAHSLGIGEIKLYSALNQKLNAEIALSLAADEDLADIKVSLATPDKFDKLGISWSYFLSRVRFQPVVKANGRVVIKMTSDEVVQEPFLDFLVEVSWPKGDIYKEFTVLVDPPAAYQQRRIEAPTVSTSSRVVYSSPGVSTAVQSTPGNLSSRVVDGQYGPTSRNDSLWKVAERVKDRDTSVEQMMMALYKANPHAFYKQNVNALMQGKTLKIPEKTEILKLSKKQANTRFYRQMAVWEGRAVSEPEPELQLVSDTDNNQLTLVPPDADEGEGTDSYSEPLADNASGSERLAAENQKLQDRLVNLEKQFAIMQEMMVIKDQQLAVMQNAQFGRVPEDGKQAVADHTKEPVSQEEIGKEPVATVDIEPIQGADTTQTITKKPPVTPVHKVAEQPAVQVEDDSGVNYYYIGLGLFGILSIGAIGLLFWRRRQAEEEINENSMFAASSAIFLPDTDDEVADVNVLEGDSAYDVGTVGESSFLSEFTPSDFDVFETDQAEVDPTSEADVYLAYGRYQQAEELMRQAITDYPDNDDYKLKLLEIFYTSENGEGYEGFANELVAEGKNTDLNFWAKVLDMGRELIPDSALLSPEQIEPKFVSDDEPAEATLDIDDVEQATEVSSDKDDFDLSSFSLEDDSDTTSVEFTDEAVSDADNESVDFDLDSFSLMDDSEDEPSEASGETIAEADSDLETIDFDLSSFESDVSSSEKDSVESSSPDNSADEAIESIEFDTDIKGFDISEEGITLESGDELTTTDVTEIQPVEESSSNDFDFNFDEISDAPVAESVSDSESHDEIDLMVSDLTDMDEFETKIDLAKAYIDMGDESAAKDIVQEVLEKGSDTQKVEAQAIIDKLG